MDAIMMYKDPTVLQIDREDWSNCVDVHLRFLALKCNIGHRDLLIMYIFTGCTHVHRIWSDKAKQHRNISAI